MTCFSPLAAYQLAGGEIVFSERAARSSLLRELSLPCGQCVGCRLERSRQWAVRCMHESQMHERNSYLTLTFDDENALELLPHGCSLDYRPFQLFMKRARKASSEKLRFYMCGEYGEDGKRPHYHAIVFGLGFDDLQPWCKSPSGAQLYRSAQLEQLWPHGFSSVGAVTFESAAYVARYVMKKITGREAESHYSRFSPVTGECFNVQPEFNRMSLKPGIGFPWFERYLRDVYPHDHVIVNGVRQKPPKAYDRYLTVLDPQEFEFIEFGRTVRAREILGENTPDRLRVREVVTRARISSLQRNKVE